MIDVDFKISRRSIVGVVTILAALGLWYGLTVSWKWISPVRFPAPAEVWDAFIQISYEGYGNGLLYQHVLHSLRLVGMGFAAAVAIGVPMGLLMGHSRRAEALLNPAFLLLRPIPPLAWIPLAIVWLGLGDSAKILVIFVAAFVPSVINSYAGVRAMDLPILEAARGTMCHSAISPDPTFRSRAPARNARAPAPSRAATARP